MAQEACAHSTSPTRRFVYVGGSPAAQSVVPDAPGFQKVLIENEHKGIDIFCVGDDGHSLEDGGFVELDYHILWLALHPTNGHFYGSGTNEKIHSFAIQQDGSLRLVNSVDSLGLSVHIEISNDGKWALSANYISSQVVVFPILPDGSLADATDSKLHRVPLNAALADRQEDCHPHQVRLDPHTNRWALCCDLGADRIWIYAFDGERGGLLGALNSRRHLSFPEGAGPRHLDFHPSGKWVYVLCELDGNLVVCDWDAANGQLLVKQSMYVLPEGMQCSRAHHSGNGHVVVSADGRTVYASSRTDNQIVVFRVEPDTGLLERVQSVPSEGLCPRHFHIDYASTPPQLRLGNQDSQLVMSYSVADGGELFGPPEKHILEGVCPSCVAIATIGSHSTSTAMCQG